MNNPIQQQFDPSNKVVQWTRNAFQAVIIFFITVVAVHVALIYLAFQTRAWQVTVIAGTVVLLEICGVIGIRLIRRDQVELGIQLIFGPWLLILLLTSGLIAGFGLLLMVTAVTIIMMIAGQTLPQKSAGRMIIIGVVMSVAMLLLDIFGPEGRLAVPELQRVIIVIAALLLVVYGFLTIRQFANYSLRTKIIIGFVATGVLAAGAIAFATNYLTRQALTDTANQALLAAARQTATSLDTFIATNQDYLRTQAQLPTFVKYLSLPPAERPGSALEAEVGQILRAFSEQDPLFISSYALLDQQGIDVIDTYPPDIGLDKSDRDYFKIPLQNGLPYVSPTRLSDTTREFAFYFSSPVRNATDEIIGVLCMRYNAAILQQLIGQSEGLAGEQSFAILLDENHIRLAHGLDPNLIFKSVVPLDPAHLAELQADGRLPAGAPAELSTNLPTFEQGLNQAETRPVFETVLHVIKEGVGTVAVTRMKTQPWLVVFGQAQNIYLAPIQAQTRSTVLLTTFITLGVALAALGLGQFLARPIVRLTGVAQRVTAGDLEVQAVVESRDETGQLAEVFNQMTGQLRSFIGSLEDQVRERTAELALSMEVGQRAAAIRSLDELLPTITEYIRAQFNLYYTQVYFVDDLGQNLVLRVGTGSVGVQLLARRHQLPIGLGSIVGRVVAEGKSIVVPDTQNSEIYKANPLLPETRAELAVPLKVEGRVIGVLDMQANKANTFTENNLTVFEAMATQLAISIDSAQQWALAQEAQRKSEEAVRQLTRQGWAEGLASRRKSLGFTYDLSTIAPLPNYRQISDVGLEITDGQLEIENPKSTRGGQSEIENRLAVPVVVQNEPIGQLAVEVPSQRTLSTDERGILAAVAQQLAQKAENLRLFEQTQQRAAREQIARQIADKVRSSRDIESALKIAAEELAKNLGVARAVVDLQVAPVDEPTNELTNK